MRTLVLITSHFPFIKGETFLESEFDFLGRNFDRVLIIAQDVTSTGAREIHQNTSVFRYNTSTKLLGFIFLPVLLIKNMFLITKLIQVEFSFRRSIRSNMRVLQLFYLLKKIIKALQLKEFLNDVLIKEKADRNIVFYSYWLNSGAHAISLMKYPSSVMIARAHGSDLYEEKSERKYLPLLSSTCKNLNAIFFVSENGRRYLINKLGTGEEKFRLSYLGISNPFIPKSIRMPDKFVIVSCSNMIALKRIDLIIRSLELISLEKQIKWMHFGDGILKKELQSLAEDLLSRNESIEYRFMGHFPNKELLEFYSTNRIDLFINVSSTEGLPVSIMEAQSAGIPVIATNVGGVSEIVVEGTGTLIDQDFETDQLTNLITYYYNLPESQIQKIRENAYNNWKNGFNASVNYSKFIESINVIFASANQ